MQIIKGNGICGGIAIGILSFYKEPWHNGDYASVADVSKELERLDKAVTAANIYLEDIVSKAESEVGDATAAIFSAHQIMLRDPEYTGLMREIIMKEGMNCEYALHKVSRHYRKVFESMDDEYMRGRAEDVNSLEKYIWNNLGEVNETLYQDQEPRILASDEFLASSMIRLDKSRVLGFVSRKGTLTGHSAILARNMGIPAVFQIENDLSEELNGHMAVIDGYEGIVYIDPDQETLRAKKEQKEQNDLKNRSLEDNYYACPKTKDGRCVSLFSNIGIIEDLDMVETQKSGGIGLFRTEFLFCVWGDFPSEDNQVEAYKKAAEVMKGKPVVVRTLDVSGDKNLPYMENGWEINPELGFRGIRYSLSHKEIFKTQLKALLRAGTYGDIRIMYPMVSSLEEIDKAREILEEAKEELTNDNISFRRDIPVGIMVETPAAALLSDEFAEKVDFFSIGSNDLAQYTLAADRQNENLAEYINDKSPAVMKLIELTVKNANKAGIPVEICGEIACDPSLTEKFIEMGVTALSMAPVRIPEVFNTVEEVGK